LGKRIFRQRTEDIDDQIATGGKNGVQFEYLLINKLLYSSLPCMIGGYPGENDVLGIYYPSGTGHECICSGAQEIYEYGEYTYTVYKLPSIAGGILSQSNYAVFIDSSIYLYMNWGKTGGISNQWDNCSLPTGHSTDFVINTNYQFFQTILYNIYH
jgi:hypothetical protein